MSARATLSEKIEALDYYHALDTPSQLATVRKFKNMFRVTKSTFNRWIHEEQQLRLAYDKLNHQGRTHRKTLNKRDRVYLGIEDEGSSAFQLDENIDIRLTALAAQENNPELVQGVKSKNKPVVPKIAYEGLQIYYEQALIAYYCSPKTYPRELLYERTMNEAITALMYKLGYGNIPVKMSRGWYHNFKSQFKDVSEFCKNFSLQFEGLLKEYEPKHLIDDIDKERSRIKKILSEYKLRNIYHMDETCLKNSLRGCSGDDLTIGICINATGDDLLPPLIVCNRRLPGFYKNERVFVNYHKDLNYKKIYFIEFVTTLDRQCIKNHRKVVLLLDCLWQHIVAPDTLKNVRMVYFNPNFETKYSLVNESHDASLGKVEIQPLNLGVIRTFKAVFKHAMLTHFIGEYLAGGSDYVHNWLYTDDGDWKLKNDGILFTLLYDSWEKLSSFQNIIRKCFQDSSILPLIYCEKTYERKKTTTSSYNADLDLKCVGYYQFIVEETMNISKENIDIDDLIFPSAETVRNRYLQIDDIIRQLEEKNGDEEVKSDPSIADSSTSALPLTPLRELELFLQNNSDKFSRSHGLFERLKHTIYEEFTGANADQDNTNLKRMLDHAHKSFNAKRTANPK